MQITVGNLKEKILEAYYTKGIKPQIVSDVKNVKAKPCLAYRISDILDIKDSTLSVKDSSASALDGDFVINENSIFVLNFFNNKQTLQGNICPTEPFTFFQNRYIYF